MIALPVSFYILMAYGLVLTAALFSERFNLFINSISGNHKVSLNENLVPCYYRVSYPARFSWADSQRRER